MTTSLKRPIPDIYGVENWGNRYYDVNSAGHLVLKPFRSEVGIDILEVVESLRRKGLEPPVLLRFPQVLETQVRTLHGAFESAIREFDYGSSYQCVFPMKVNHRRDVVDHLLRIGSKHRLGIEVGSKAELYVALSLEQAPDSLLICNGFKDAEFMEMAFWGAKIGKNVVIVVEQIREINSYIALVERTGLRPLIGLRGKLYARGSGKWVESGGETSKFGMTTVELLECCRLLREKELLDSLAMLHFHIGSQITDIRTINSAVKEASRVYAKFRKMDVPIQYLNVGGGLGIDYDGSGTSSDSSVNYEVEEYANGVVYTVSAICSSEDVPVPILVSESGRALTVYHAILVVRTEDRWDPDLDSRYPPSRPTKSPALSEMLDILGEINVKNFREYYHDALQQREELLTLFDLGYLGLEERAQGEMLFRQICEQALRYSRQAGYESDEFEVLERAMRRRYVSNFSVFQSVPDAWTIRQLFPILPIHRLNEVPDRYGMLVDLSCDSDGKIDSFIDIKEIKDVLELHTVRPGEPYYLGICLLGAYQDVMGDFHNLFGTVNEGHVVVDTSGRVRIERMLRGNTIEEVTGLVGFDSKLLLDGFQARVKDRVRRGEIDEEGGSTLVESFRRRARGSTYLSER